MNNVINNVDRFGFLEIRSEREGDRYVVAHSGELDTDGIERVERELRRAEASDAAKLVLDFSALEFIDSSGIRLVVEAHERSRADGRRLVLIHGPRAVRRVFELTDLVDRLPFEE
jgi:anti-anti-sigma factor